ncbi:MAG: cytochrome c biogenesis heme-transporting ATPase CcmA [Pseudomonadota bacterium]
MGEPFLETVDLNIERGGRQLIRDFSLRVNSGQLVQIRGSNGAGKTTLLRVLGGLSRFGFTGSLHQSESLLFIGHQSAVKALLTPRENLLFHLTGEGVHRGIDIERALASVGLYGFEDVPSSQLSAGQQRRVNLARLFLTRQTLWLLDEPFTALDQAGVLLLEDRFRAHLQSGGAILMTSHQPLQTIQPDVELDLSGL